MPLNILLADDSVPAQSMGMKILTDAGYHVRTVSNGLEALRKIADSVPDIVILDIFMPGYTGLEICERLRASAATASLPVILTVGRLEPYRPEDGEHVHANAVIVKPFAAAELIAAVRSLIGTPPAEAAEADPAPAVESLVGNSGDDPLQELSFAAPADVSSELTLNHSASTDGQSAGASHEGVSDDMLFSYREPATPEGATPWGSAEPSTESSELLLSDESPNGPESLVFNPDAAPTPFSTSVIDLPPSEAHFSSGNDASAFSEFELEPEASHDPFAPELELATQVTSFSEAAGAGPIGFSATTTALAASEAPVFMPESNIALEEAVSARPIQEGSPTPDAPALDDWLELPEAAAPNKDLLMPTVPDLGETAEEVTLEDVPNSAAGAEVATTSYAGQPVEDDEARRLAFEALFNSTEPFPVEPFYAGSAEVSSATLPDIADMSEGRSSKVVADSEFESLLDESDLGFVAPELDPYLMHEEDSRNAASRIPERDSLLDNAFEADWSGTESTLEPTQVAPANSSEIDSPFDLQSSDELSEWMPAPLLETEPAAVQLADAETLPVARETCDEWAHPTEAQLTEAPSAEIAESNFEVLPAPQTPPEIVYPEAQRTEVEAMLPEPEMPEAEPAPVQEPEPETSPVREPEPHPAPVPPEKVSAELTEPQPEDAGEISSSPLLLPQLNENERIQQAVDRVFDRFKRLLVTAIVRELARHD